MGLRPSRTRVLPRRIGNEVDEVGLAEVAVVVGLFLDAHRRGRTKVLVPVARLLTHGAAALEQLDLAQRPRSRWRAPRLRSEFRFLISQRVPKGSPARRTETLASMRIEPSSIRPSDAPVAIKMPRSSAAYVRAWAELRMSGPETISTSGTPERL